MSRLFKRSFQLTLAKPQPNTFFGSFLPNALIVRALKVRFKIERSLEADPNTSTISVYNLSEASRAEFQVLPMHIRLDVGYGNELSGLFAGDLMFASSKKEGMDWITTFTLGDGERSYVESRVNRSFGAGVNLKDAIGETAKSMGLKIPSNVADAKGLAGQFVSGLSVTGPSRSQMSKLLGPRGYTWSIQDGQLQILGPNDHRAEAAIRIARDTGMVESPELGAPKEPGKPPTLTAKCLINTQIIPGGRIFLDAQKLKGLFRVERVRHSGDSRDRDWYSEIEAIPL